MQNLLPICKAEIFRGSLTKTLISMFINIHPLPPVPGEAIKDRKFIHYKKEIYLAIEMLLMKKEWELAETLKENYLVLWFVQFEAMSI